MPEAQANGPKGQLNPLQIPAHTWKIVQIPARNTLSPSGDLALSEQLATAYHTGPVLTTVEHLCRTYESRLDPVLSSDNATAIPPSPEFTLMNYHPGSQQPPTGRGSLSLESYFDVQKTTTEDTKIEPGLVYQPELPKLYGEQRAPVTVAGASFSSSSRSQPDFPSLSAHAVLTMGVDPRPSETVYCSRPCVPGPGDSRMEVDRSPCLFPLRPLMSRFIVRLDRLCVPGAEKHWGSAARRAASLATSRPQSDQILLDANGLPNEPIWVTVALYSLEEKRRISDVFGWHLGPDWTAPMCVSASQATNSRQCRTAMFSIPAPSSGVFLVARLYRVLQGSTGTAADVYADCAKSAEQAKTPESISPDGKHLSAKLRKEVGVFRDSTLAAMRRFTGATVPLESFAVAYRQVFDSPRRSNDVWSLFSAECTNSSERLPAFSMKVDRGLEELRQQVNKQPPDQRGVNGDRDTARLAGGRSNEYGGVEGYSVDWLQYRINAAAYDDTVLELGPFYELSASTGPKTLLELITATSSQDVETGDEERQNDYEVQATRSKNRVLGDDGTVLRILHDSRLGKQPRSLAFSLLCNGRILTAVNPTMIPSDEHPQILPKRLLRPDRTGMQSNPCDPPLHWLLGIDVPEFFSNDEVVQDVLALPARAPLFTERDRQNIGLAGYQEDSGAQSSCPELVQLASSLPTAPLAVSMADSNDFAGISEGQCLGRLMGADQGTMYQAVSEGGRSILVSPDQRDTGAAHPLTEHSDVLADCWLSLPQPGSFQPQSGKNHGTLGGVCDLISVAPLQVNFRATKFLSRKTRARNVAVRVELCADDSVGRGAWSRVYSDPRVANQSSISAALQLLAPGNDDLMAAISGPAEANPHLGSQRAIRCVFPADCGSADLRDVAKVENGCALESDSPGCQGCVSAGGYALTSPLMKAGLTSVTYHDRAPCFSESFLMALPVVPSVAAPVAGRIPPRAHLLFTFYHVVVKEEGDKGEGSSWCPVGYAFYPLCDPRCPNRLSSARNIQLPIAAFLPPGYLSVCGIKACGEAAKVMPDVPASHIPWLQVEKTRLSDKSVIVEATPMFTFNLELLSTVRTSSQALAALLSACDEVVAVPPTQLCPADMEKQGPLSPFHILPNKIPSLRLLSDAAQFVQHMSVVLSALTTALDYASVCSELRLPLEAPRIKSQRARTMTTTRNVELKYKLFHTLVRVLELASSLSDVTASDSRRHPLLEFWVSGIYDGKYRGRSPLRQLTDEKLVASQAVELRERLDLTADTHYPTATELISLWSDVFETEGRSGTSSDTQIQTAEMSWVLFDIILKDIRCAGARACGGTFDLCRLPGDFYSERTRTELRRLVSTLTGWIASGCSQQQITRNHLNSNMVLFLRSLFDCMPHKDALELIRTWDQGLWRAIIQSDKQQAVWELRCSGWQIIADHPFFSALCSSVGVNSLRSEWLNSLKWQSWLTRNHGPVALFTECINQGLTNEKQAVRIEAADTLLQYLIKVDTNAMLSLEGKQAVCSLLWGEVAFIMRHARDIFSSLPSTRDRPLCAGACSAECQPEPPDHALRLKLLTCLALLLRLLPPSLMSDYMRLEIPSRRTQIVDVLLEMISDFDVRALLIDVRRLTNQGSKMKQAIESLYDGKQNRKRRKRAGLNQLSSFADSCQTFSAAMDPFADDARGQDTQMRTWRRSVRGSIYSDQAGEEANLIRYTGGLGELYDPLRVAGITAQNLKRLMDRENAASHFSAAIGATVLDVVCLLIQTEKAQGPGVVPQELAVLIALLSAPAPVVPWGYHTVASAASHVLSCCPGLVIRAALCGDMVTALLRVMASTQTAARNCAASLFYALLRSNWLMFGREALRQAKYAYPPDVQSALEDLASNPNSEPSLACVRVASQVSMSYLVSERATIATVRQRTTPAPSEVPDKNGFAIDFSCFLVPFASTATEAAAFGQALEEVAHFAGSDTAPLLRRSVFTLGLQNLSVALRNVVADSGILAELSRGDGSHDFTDLVDLYMRQACLYMSIPCVALRMLESLLDCLLFCSGILKYDRTRREPDIDLAYFTEAGATAALAAGILASRILVPLPSSREVGGTETECLGAEIIAQLATACPYLATLQRGGTAALATALQSATFLGGSASSPLQIDAADAAVAQEYSASDAQNYSMILRLLQIASNCWHLEGPLTENAMALAIEQMHLQTRLALLRGRLGDDCLAPGAEQLTTIVRPVSLLSFSEAPAPSIDSMGPIQPGLPWYLANEATARRMAAMSQRASEGDRKAPNFYRVTVYGALFFRLAAAMSDSGEACNIHGQTFIYRSHTAVRLEEFCDEMKNQWTRRIEGVFNAYLQHRKLGECDNELVSPELAEKMGQGVAGFLHVATKAVEQELVARTEREPLVVIQLTTVRPMRATPFYDQTGGRDLDALASIIGSEEEARAVFGRLKVEDAAAGLIGDDCRTATFFYESLHDTLSGKAKVSPAGAYFTSTHRHILRVPVEYPAPIPRQRVISEQTLEMTPIRSAINTLKLQTQRLELAALDVARGNSVPVALDVEGWLAAHEDVPPPSDSMLPMERQSYFAVRRDLIAFGITNDNLAEQRDTTGIQLLIQGSVLVMINSGPVAIVRAFLAPDKSSWPEGGDKAVAPTSGELTELRLVMARFLRVTRFALDVEAAYCPPPHQPLHLEMEAAWLSTRQQLSDMGVPVNT